MTGESSAGLLTPAQCLGAPGSLPHLPHRKLSSCPPSRPGLSFRAVGRSHVLLDALSVCLPRKHGQGKPVHSLQGHSSALGQPGKRTACSSVVIFYSFCFSQAGDAGAEDQRPPDRAGHHFDFQGLKMNRFGKAECTPCTLSPPLSSGFTEQ